ncbi:MAG: hypothetical protein AB7O49_15560 [Sphingomonadales bacterium]
MKLGLFAALTGLAVAVGLSKMKRDEALPAPTGKRAKTPAPSAGAPKQAPVTGAAPQEGVNLKTATPSPEKTDGGARVTAP